MKKKVLNGIIGAVFSIMVIGFFVYGLVTFNTRTTYVPMTILTKIVEIPMEKTDWFSVVVSLLGIYVGYVLLVLNIVFIFPKHWNKNIDVLDEEESI